MEEQKGVTIKEGEQNGIPKVISINQWIISTLVISITCLIIGIALAEFILRTQTPKDTGQGVTTEASQPNTNATYKKKTCNKELYNFRELTSYIQDQNIESFTLKLNNGRILEIKVK